MEKLLKDVELFNKTSGNLINVTPTIPSEKHTTLRVRLLKEEMSELETAIAENDIVGVADALCDIQYILAGAISEFGLSDKFEALFNEVQRSNMSKFTDNIDDMLLAQDQYDVDTIINKVGKKYVIKRATDGKVLKGIHYSEPNLKQFID